MEKTLLQIDEPGHLTWEEQRRTDGAPRHSGAAQPSPGHARGCFPGQGQQGKSRALLSAGEEEEEIREKRKGVISVSLSVL